MRVWDKQAAVGALLCARPRLRRDTERTPSLPSAVSLTQDLADGGIVHVGEGLQDPPALVLCPHHEGIHGSLYVA